MDEETRREIILENYMHPDNRIDEEKNGYLKENTNNESCIDNLNIYVKVSDNIIEDIYFNGEACAISTSSVSIMIHNLIGKTVREALEFIDNFERMIEGQDYNEEILNDAIVYSEIYKQNNRKNCAYLPYRGIKKILESQM